MLLEDDPREEWTKTTTTLKTIEKVHNIMLDDRRVKVCEIAMGISEESVRNILLKELRMQKLCARWLLHLLNAYQKQMHKQNLQQCLDRFKRDPTDFM